jgi:hypothetical protein
MTVKSLAVSQGNVLDLARGKRKWQAKKTTIAWKLKSGDLLEHNYQISNQIQKEPRSLVTRHGPRENHVDILENNLKSDIENSWMMMAPETENHSVKM